MLTDRRIRLSLRSIAATHPFSLSAGELASAIAMGEQTATQAVEACIRRISRVNPPLNALVAPLFDSARRQAFLADLAQARGEPLGPLHGVPISVKESFQVSGSAATVGLPSRKSRIDAHDAPLVARLRAAGAIVLGKTNVPQMIGCYETENPLYGRTNNPWNLTRSPGGSSGGEAALLAVGGSFLGLGSDYGGSLRQPAHACGVHALKPTNGRLTLRGHLTDENGSSQGFFQAGPMARRVSDLALALRAMTAPGADPIDPHIVSPPLGDHRRVAVRHLRIGYFLDDGFFRPSPAIRRVVEESVAALRRAGAIVETFAPPRIHEALRIYYGLHFYDGLDRWKPWLANNPRDLRVRRALASASLPTFLRKPLACALRWCGQSRLSQALAWNPRQRLSIGQYETLQAERHGYRREFLAALDAQRLDVLIGPPHGLPAFDRGRCYSLGLTGSYCQLYNLLGLPAGTVSLSRIRPGEESDRQPGRDLFERVAQTIERGSAGLPLGVQVAARHWREDQTLAVMEFLETAFSANDDYPVGRLLDREFPSAQS